MSTPVAIANAFSDATGLSDITLPLTKSKIHYYLKNKYSENKPVNTTILSSKKNSELISDSGEISINITKNELWKKLLDPKVLSEIIPGCKNIELKNKTSYLGTIVLKIGPIKGEYKFFIKITDIKEQTSFNLVGNATGKLGSGSGKAIIKFIKADDNTKLTYSYAAKVNGKISLVGNRLLNSASKIIIKQFFNSFAKIKHDKSNILINFLKKYINDMKPPSFDYVQPETINETLTILEYYRDEAQILAGGQSLVSMLNMRLIKPKVLVDINFIKDTAYFNLTNQSICIGPNYRQLDIEMRKETKLDSPLIYQAIPYVGHVQHRARGTIVGSICHGDPTSELPLCFLALKGKITLNSKNNVRKVKADDFYLGPLLTAKESNELATEIELPVSKKDTGYAFDEVSEKFGDFAIASFACVSNKDIIRFAVGGVSDRPIAIEWDNVNNIDLNEKLNEFAWTLDIEDNQHTSARYKRDLIRNCGLKTILKSLKNI